MNFAVSQKFAKSAFELYFSTHVIHSLYATELAILFGGIPFNLCNLNELFYSRMNCTLRLTWILFIEVIHQNVYSTEEPAVYTSSSKHFGTKIGVYGRMEW